MISGVGAAKNLDSQVNSLAVALFVNRHAEAPLKIADTLAYAGELLGCNFRIIDYQFTCFDHRPGEFLSTCSRTNINISDSAPFSLESEHVSYSANLVASWDPDIFGVLREQERAAVARIDAAQDGAAAVRLALLAEIAGTAIDWRTIEARKTALPHDLEAALELVRLSQVREDAGIAPGFARVRAETAAATLAAEDAELAATARNRFPKFDLSAALGLLSFDLGDLLDEDSIVGSLAGSVAAHGSNLVLPTS